MNRKAKLMGCLMTLAVSGVFFVALQPNSRSDDKAPDTLKQRVSDFYTALHANDAEKAAQYVIEKARDNFRSKSHGKFLDFEITRLELEQDSQSAIVELSFKVMIPTIFRQIYIPDRTRWKLVSGEWFYDPDDIPPQLGDKMKEYYYDKQAAGNAKSTPKPVPFERDLVDIGFVDKGKLLSLHFPFSNQSSQEIKIEEVYFRGVSFLKDTTTKRLFKPGEKGEISVELDTTELSGPLDHSFFVEFQPIKEMVSLRIKGKVAVKQKTDAPKPANKSFTPSPK